MTSKVAERGLLSADTARPVAGATLARALLFVFAAGIPLDVVLAGRIGSSSIALGIPLVVAGAWQVLYTRTFRRLPAALLLLALFVGWGAASVVWCRDVENLVIRTQTNLQLLVSVVLAWQIVRSRPDLRAAIAGYVVGCTFAAADTWRTFLAGGSGEPSRYAYRYHAESYDPNDMAVTLAIGIPMAAFLSLSARSSSRAWFAYVPLGLTTVVLTGSRGGTLAMAVAVAAITVWFARRSRSSFAGAFAALTIAMALAAAVIPPQTVTRIFTVRNELASGTMGDRTVIWRAGLDVLNRHTLVGVGAGGYADAVAPALFQRAVAHSTLLSVAVELGVIGFVLFVSAFAAVVLGGARAARDDRALAWILVITWLVGSASLTWEYDKVTWFVILLGAGAAGLRATEGRPPRHAAADA